MSKRSRRQSFAARQKTLRAMKSLRRKHAGRPGFTGEVLHFVLRVEGQPPKDHGLVAVYVTPFTNAVARPVQIAN